MSSDTAGRPRLRAVLVAFGLALLGFVLVLPAAFVVSGVYTAAFGAEVDDVAALGISMIALQGIAFPVTAWLYVRRRGVSWEYIPVAAPDLRDIAYVVAGFVFAFVAANVIGAALITVFSTEPAQNTGATTALANPEIIPYLAVLQILLIGPGEELLYRGVVQNRLGEALPAPAAIFLASLIFASIHFFSLSGAPQARLVSISVLVLPTLVFGTMYELSENLVVPALIHGAYNATLFSLLYITIRFAGMGELPQFLAVVSTTLPL